ncbi:hypothetical protein T265_14954, partial [Opisthorchis viverrini]
WLEHEFTDRRVVVRTQTSACRLPLSRLGQPGNVPALVLPSGGIAARHRKGVTAVPFFGDSATGCGSWFSLKISELQVNSPILGEFALSFSARSLVRPMMVHNHTTSSSLTNSTMERVGDGFLSVSRVLDELIKYRWKDARRPRAELDEIRRSLRAKALESFFLFQKGPHKRLKWLEREFSDLKIRSSNPTSTSRLPLSRLGQPGSTPALVLTSGSMATRHRKGATAERYL